MKSKPIAVVYSLTKLGKAFIVTLDSICGLTKSNNKELTAVFRLETQNPKGRGNCYQERT